MDNEQEIKKFLDVVARNLSGHHIGNVMVMAAENFNNIQRAFFDLPKDLLREVCETDPL